MGKGRDNRKRGEKGRRVGGVEHKGGVEERVERRGRQRWGNYGGGGEEMGGKSRPGNKKKQTKGDLGNRNGGGQRGEQGRLGGGITRVGNQGDGRRRKEEGGRRKGGGEGAKGGNKEGKDREKESIENEAEGGKTNKTKG